LFAENYGIRCPRQNHFRSKLPLAELIGHAIPSPETPNFLYEFHAEVLRLAARRERRAEWIEALGLLWVPAPR